MNVGGGGGGGRTNAQNQQPQQSRYVSMETPLRSGAGPQLGAAAGGRNVAPVGASRQQPVPDLAAEHRCYRSPFSDHYRFAAGSMVHNFSDYKRCYTWRRLWLYIAKAEKVKAYAGLADRGS